MGTSNAIKSNNKNAKQVQQNWRICCFCWFQPTYHGGCIFVPVLQACKYIYSIGVLLPRCYLRSPPEFHFHKTQGSMNTIVTNCHASGIVLIAAIHTVQMDLVASIVPPATSITRNARTDISVMSAEWHTVLVSKCILKPVTGEAWNIKSVIISFAAHTKRWVLEKMFLSSCTKHHVNTQLICMASLRR